MTVSAYTCRYCRQASDASGDSCPNCGAPIDVRRSVSKSGWEKQPGIKDMARIQFGRSHVQIEGTTVPVADFALAAGEWIYFSHHKLLWAEPSAQLSAMNLGGGWNRVLAGLPLIMMQGAGPGHIAISDNHAGEMIALPLQHGQSVAVREHRLLAASGNVTYTWSAAGVWFQTGYGDDKEMHYPMGPYGDIFTAQNAPGLLLLHAPGNTFFRDLEPNETLLIQPTALLYHDLSVKMHLHLEYPRNRGYSFSRYYDYRHVWIRLIGPGRVAVQSIFERPETHSTISRHSYATQRSW
jgi:uncharacterized protein (AIM24 family)